MDCGSTERSVTTLSNVYNPGQVNSREESDY